MTLTANERAQRSAQAMWATDEASKWVGLSLDQVAPGQATLSLIVQSHHTNGHKICHGGVIFTLADSAFAFACNSYNQIAVAAQNSIVLSRPANWGMC